MSKLRDGMNPTAWVRLLLKLALHLTPTEQQMFNQADRHWDRRPEQRDRIEALHAALLELAAWRAKNGVKRMPPSEVSAILGVK